jgi:hypothetical protein
MQSAVRAIASGGTALFSLSFVTIWTVSGRSDSKAPRLIASFERMVPITVARSPSRARRTRLAAPRAMTQAEPSLMSDPPGLRLIRFVSDPPAFSSLVISITSPHPCVARPGRSDHRIGLSDVGGGASAIIS